VVHTAGGGLDFRDRQECQDLFICGTLKTVNNFDENNWPAAVGEDGSNYGLLGAIKCVRVHKYCQLARGHRSMMGRRYSRTARSQETGLIANRKTENCETATGNKLRNNHQWGLSYIYDRWSWSCGGWVD